MNRQLKKFTAGALCLSLAASALAGCGKKEESLDRTKALITLNENNKMDAGTANFILRYNQSEFESGFGAFIKSYYGGLWDVDLMGSGEVYGDTFKAQVVDTLEQMMLAEAHMEELGIEITAEEEEAMKAAAKQFLADNADYAAALDEMTADEDTVTAMLRYYTIQAKAEKVITADVDTEVSDEEAAQRTVSYVSFTAETESAEAVEETTEEEAVTEEAETAAESVAEVSADIEEETSVKTSSADETEELSEAAEEAVFEGESEAETEGETESAEMIAARAQTLAQAEAFLAEASEAEDAEAFEKLGSTAAEDNDSINTGSYTFGDDDTYPAAEIIEATKELDDNTLVNDVIVSGTTYYVLYVADAFDEEATENKKAEIVENRKHEAIDSRYADWSDEAAFAVDETLLASLAFNFSLTQETEAETEEISELTPEETESVTEAETEEVSEQETEGLSEAATEGLSESVEELAG